MSGISLAPSIGMPDSRPPLAQLESALIEQFLRARGHDAGSLAALPAAEREALLKDASLYASVKMAEVESRSHFVDDIHGSTPGAAKPGLE